MQVIDNPTDDAKIPIVQNGTNYSMPFGTLNKLLIQIYKNSDILKQITDADAEVARRLTALTYVENNMSAAEGQREISVRNALENIAEASGKAEDTAAHPGYVDNDGYYYKWNVETKTYEKTDVNLKGEKGDTFTFDDLTDEQVSALMAPATDAATNANAAADACNTATTKANDATAAANTATTNAVAATEAAVTAKQNADAATASATAATGLANTAAAGATTAKQNADAATDAANTAAALANQKATLAQTAADAANTAASLANQKATLAQTAADAANTAASTATDAANTAINSIMMYTDSLSKKLDSSKINVLSEDEYTALTTKEEGKIYFIYS